MGQVKSTGTVLALSRSDEPFNFFDVGGLAGSSEPFVQDVLGKLSSATGLKMERVPSRNSTIAIFHDANVFARLRDDRAAFRSTGLSDQIIDELQQKLTTEARCITMTKTDGDMNIVLTVVLSSQPDKEKFDGCLIGGLLNSFGLRSAEKLDEGTLSENKLVSACVLYDARREGVRDRQHLSEEAATLRNKCAARIAGAQ